MRFFKKTAACLLAAACAFGLFGAAGCAEDPASQGAGDPVAYYAFDEGQSSQTTEAVSGRSLTIQNVFSEENQANLMKPASDPLWREGVKGNCLYMDGISNYIQDDSFENIRTGSLTVSAWVAPRVFENNFNPEGLTCIVGKGDVGFNEGWLLGYGYLGTWGLKVALEDPETGDVFTAAFYDPENYLPLYEWSHVAASYDAPSGRICLYLNGELVYEQIYAEYAGCEMVAASDPLRVGKYISPATVYGIDCNLVAGLLDEVYAGGPGGLPGRSGGGDRQDGGLPPPVHRALPVRDLPHPHRGGHAGGAGAHPRVPHRRRHRRDGGIPPLVRPPHRAGAALHGPPGVNLKRPLSRPVPGPAAFFVTGAKSMIKLHT